MNGLKWLLVVSALGMFAAVGCNGTTDEATDSPPVSNGENHEDGHDHEDGDEHSHEGEADAEASAQIDENLAKLSDEDRKLAVAQVICPVTDKKLGSMGAPLKVDVDGTPVFICCEGCEAKVLENPEETLAKLNKDNE